MNNPVLKRELKTSSRSWKLMGIVTFNTVILAFILCSFLAVSYFNNYGIGGIDVNSFIGIYISLVSFVIIMIGFITPATTAGAIAGERQRRTFDLLVCTRLSGLEIAVGKLMAGILKSVMIIIVSTPMFAIISIYGGISISQIGLMFIFIVVFSIYIGSIGLFTSSLVSKSVVATIIAYVIMGITAFGIPIFLLIMIESLTYSTGFVTANHLDFLYIFMYGSPLSGFMSLLDFQLGTGTLMVNIDGFAVFPLRDFYINILYMLVTSGLLVYGTSRNVNPIKKRVSKRTEKIAAKKMIKENKKV